MHCSRGKACKIAFIIAAPIVGLAQPFASRGHELAFAYSGPACPHYADIERVVADATAIFKKKDCKADIPCDYTLAPKSPITQSANKLGRLTSEIGIITIQNETGANVIIAERIARSACSNSQDAAFGPGRILGCAPVGAGTWIAIVRDLPSMSVVLAHEFGHSAGMPHRNALRALMNPVYARTNRALDSWECAQLHYPITNPPRPPRRSPKKSPKKPAKSAPPRRPSRQS